MTLGYVAALGVLMLQVRRAEPAEAEKGINRPQVWDLFIVMVVSSILGAKIGHTLFEAPGHLAADGHTIGSLGELLREDPWHWARLGEAGYVWYGGLIGALLVAAFYFWRRPHLSGALMSDAFAPAIVAGAVPGRLGCFLAGCCYGQPTSSAFGVKFPHLDVPVHPTQLYDASSALVLAVGLYALYPRRRFDGQIISLLLMGYAVLRFFTEAFRGDLDRGAIGAVSTSQFLSIPLFLVGLGLYFYLRKVGARTRGPASGGGPESAEPTESTDSTGSEGPGPNVDSLASDR
jgi:phosphatidylglycerol:prolipoprotein diacylglycerol transferase